MSPLNSPAVLSRSDFLAALCLSFMMVPCPLCLADHELIVCKMLGTENTKDIKCFFLWQLFGKVSFCCFLVVVVFFTHLYVPPETLRFVVRILLFLTPQSNSDNISRLLGSNSI